MKDKIKPNHYPNAGKNDLIQFALDNNVGAIEFNIIKYVIRYKDKNGLEDLNKAKEYLNRLIENEEKENKIPDAFSHEGEYPKVGIKPNYIHPEEGMGLFRAKQDACIIDKEVLEKEREWERELLAGTKKADEHLEKLREIMQRDYEKHFIPPFG